MNIYSAYDDIGKKNIKANGADLISFIGVDGLKDIIKNVFLGGNVRDTTEFITQRRLLNTYAATLELFLSKMIKDTKSINEYSEMVINDFFSASGDAKLLDLWLLGLTQKGLDNIVRNPENLSEYGSSYVTSVTDFIESAKTKYGDIIGLFEWNQEVVEFNWDYLALLFITIGAQTLSIRGSSKSMNGKLFERLVLGSLLTIMGFNYCRTPPETVKSSEKLFWLSKMDENERETDATIIYKGKAVSIDIGFIGRGNPEITLDKVTRFGSYKEIGGIPHDMSTIIIVDTVSDGSELFSKAERVNGHVLQMSNQTWVKEFAVLLKRLFDIESDIISKEYSEYDSYFSIKLQNVDLNSFV